VLRANIPGNAAVQNQLFLILREAESYRIVATGGMFDGVARLALDLAEAGRIDQAKVWLDRVRRESTSSVGCSAAAADHLDRTRQPPARCNFTALTLM
jgi:hypothetical protein